MDESKIKIATWNLCLGLTNKKDYVSQMITVNKIDICCMQEIDVKKLQFQLVNLCGLQNWNWKKWLNRELASTLRMKSNTFAITASLELSSAIDVVNINLLLKRLRIVGLPKEVIDLIELWLNGRKYCICLMLFKL